MLYLVATTLVAVQGLARARDEAPALRRAAIVQDEAAARRGLDVVRGALGRARLAMSGPVWASLAQLPVIGDDVRAVRTTAAVGDQLVDGPIGDLSGRQAQSLVRGLLPRGGRVDLEALDELEPRVASAASDFAEASERFSAVDPGGLIGPLRRPYADLTEQVDEAAGALDAARRATQVLPSVMGQDGPRTYLLVTNNNAEVRATGGLAGSMLLLRADDGTITTVGQTRPAQIGEFSSPVLPQSRAERAIYDAQVATYAQDTNFTPEFPRTAELLREMVERREGVAVDGVIAIDAVTVSYLLRATGPLAVPDAPTLTSQNATAELLNRVYFRLPDPAAQDAYFDRVAAALFDATLRGSPDPLQLATALRQSASEGRLLVHLFAQDEQAETSGTSVAGDVFDDGGPEVGLYLNDATGSKMSYYLRRTADLEPVACGPEGRRLRGTADLTYTADSPPVADLNVSITGDGSFGTPVGQQLVLARLYGPAGGAVSDVRLDGEPLVEPAVVDRGRMVVTTAVVLSRGQTARLTWETTTPERDQDVTLALSPGMEARPAVVVAAGGCGADAEHRGGASQVD